MDAKRSVSLEQLLRTLPEDDKSLKEKFDENDLWEIRKAYLDGINEKDVSNLLWLIERFKDYLEINDYETALAILRKIAQHQKTSQEDIVALMAGAVERCLKEDVYVKKFLVILCGKINRFPELYNEDMKNIFLQVIEKCDPPGISGEEANLLRRVFHSIGRVGDVEFLPIIQKNAPGFMEVEELFEISHYDRDNGIQSKVDMEETRALLIQYLKEKKGKQAV